MNDDAEALNAAAFVFVRPIGLAANRTQSAKMVVGSFAQAVEHAIELVRIARHRLRSNSQMSNWRMNFSTDQFPFRRIMRQRRPHNETLMPENGHQQTLLVQLTLKRATPLRVLSARRGLDSIDVSLVNETGPVKYKNNKY